MRHYEEPWLILKRDHILRINADRRDHARIKKAIIKEKDMDTVYKMTNAELPTPVEAIIKPSIDPSSPTTLVFKLTFRTITSVHTI